MAEQRLTYTASEVAGLLGIGKNAAYALMADPERGFPVVKVGRRLLVPKRPFLAWAGAGERIDEDAANY